METLRRPHTRIIAGAITAITARHLISDGFHYPMTLLFSHVTIAFGLELTRRKGQRQDDFARPREKINRTYQAIHTILVISSLIFGYHSFLHLSNTPFWIMAASINWGSTLWNEPSKTRSWASTSHSIIRGITLLTCGALLVLQEHLLTNVGIRLLIIAIACFVAAGRLARRLGASLSDTTLGLENRAVPLAVSIPAAMVSWIWVEFWDAGDFRVATHIPWLVVNIVAGAIMMGQDASVVLRDGDGDERTTSGPSIRLASSSICLAVATGLDNAFALFRPTITPLSQWTAFLLAVLATIDLRELTSSSVNSSCNGAPSAVDDEESTDGIKSPLISHDYHTSTPKSGTAEQSAVSSTSEQSRSSLLLQTLLQILAWLLVVHYIVSRQTLDLPPSQLPNLDHTYDLDIVIARYDEPIHQIAESMNSILNLSNVRDLNSRVILYNKGDDELNATHMRGSFYAADEVVVRPLQNAGREADTYLAHVLDYDDDDYAAHTLFIQGEPHDQAWMEARLRQYFVPETGFLSLSDVGRFCAHCDHCGDTSGWLIDPLTLHDLFETSNPEQECRDISLTYRGQFLVSRQRLMNIERRAFEDARERVLASEPFGYTMERLWGVMFKCPRVPSTCPSLMSGFLGNLAPGGVEDCQCLDERL